MRGPRRYSPLSLLPSHFLLVAGLGTVACRGSLSPLSNRIAVGQEAYAVFVAPGENGAGDLFAIPGAGGSAFQVTLTRLDESAPALSPDGLVLAFARARTPADTARRTVWALNLASGAERRLYDAPRGGPIRIGWAGDGRTLYIRSGGELYRVGAPPEIADPRPVPDAEGPRADSALAVLLGEPAFARVVECEAGDAAPGGPAICAETESGTEVMLAVGARDPARWGSDSVAYFQGDELLVRPLGGGTIRRMEWARAPISPGQVTYFGGTGER